MARKHRQLHAGGVYHVIYRGNNRAPIYGDDEDAEYFLALLKRLKRRDGMRIFHYVVMTNHVHMVVSPDTAERLPKTMQSLARAYTAYYKHKYGFIGQLWQGRYFSSYIDSEAYLLTCGIYIELNPVRAGMVTDPASHPWSSVHAYITDRKDPLVDQSPLYAGLGRTAGECQASYRRLLEMWMKK
jgi:putative transposase